MRAFLLLALLVVAPAAGTGEFDRPWNDPAVALVIDPYAGNSIDWDKLAEETRVVAIVHKSTIGATRIDPKYFARREEARRRGYLWGSYHWGVPGDPEKQADHYLDTVKPGADELMALDLEDANGSATLMNADEALRFIHRIKERTGRYPVLYTNHASAVRISREYRNTDFAHTPLWYARFKANVTDFPTTLWRTYTLWQFSSEIKLQLPVKGVRADMDINVYNGSPKALRAAWPLTRAEPGAPPP